MNLTCIQKVTEVIFYSLEVTWKEFRSFHASNEKFVKFSNFGFNHANCEW